MRRVAATCLAALLLVLTACAGLPMTSQVYPGNEPMQIGDDPGVALVPDGPQPGASPDQIVDGFLRAGSGPQDDWATAKQFLAPDVTWMPRASVTIDRLLDRSTLVTSESADSASVTTSVTSTGVVDEGGAYTQQPDASADLPFELTRQPGGEWRISRAPNGVVLFEEQFRIVFRSAQLSYFDPTYQYLVPDVRWFPRLNAATYAASALVNRAPSAWLSGAVVSAFPEGVTIAASAVPTPGGVAQVELGEAALDLPSEVLSRMQAQLDATMRSIDVAAVQMTVDGSALRVTAAPTRSTRVDTRSLVQTQDGAVGYIDGDAIEELGDLSAAIESLGLVSAIETAPGRALAAVLTSAGTVVRAADDGTTAVLDNRSSLVPPTIDTTGTIWSAPSASPSGVAAYTADGEQISVQGAWPDATSIRAMQVSRDGTRIAAIVSVRGHDELWASGIRRSDQGLELGEHVVIDASLGAADDLAWLDDATIGVLERVGDELRLREQPVGGPGTDLTVPAGVTAIVGGNSSPRLLSDQGVVYVRQTTSWQQIATTVKVRVLVAQQGMPAP